MSLRREINGNAEQLSKFTILLLLSPKEEEKQHVPVSVTGFIEHESVHTTYTRLSYMIFGWRRCYGTRVPKSVAI